MSAEIYRLSPWMTASECADYMKCSRSHVYKHALYGALPSHGRGRARRFHIDEIDQYMRGLNRSKEQAPSLSRFQEVRQRLRSLKTSDTETPSPIPTGKRGTG